MGIDWRVTLTHIIKKCAARLWTGDASCGPVGGSCKIMFDYSRNVLCMELYLYVKVIDKVLCDDDGDDDDDDDRQPVNIHEGAIDSS